MKANRYLYERVIQGHFGCGWEDVSAYEVPRTREQREDIRHDLREYRASGQGVYRVVSRRSPNPDHVAT